MKRIVKCILCFTFAAVMIAVGVTVYADAEGDFLICEKDNGYALYRYSDGTPLLLTDSESLSELVGFTEGGKVIFDNVSISEKTELPQGAYVFSGSLKLEAALSVPQGTSLSLDNTDIVASSGSYIRVKGGEVKVSGARICGVASSPLIIDYSSSSSVTITSGTITSTSTESTVKLSRGSLNVLGGKIENSIGCAIESSGTLTFAGAPLISGVSTDIITSEPISLSHEGASFLGEIRVKVLAAFSKGTITEVFRSCNESSLAGTRVFDRDGKEYSPTFFDSSSYVDEKNFAAVYVPFTVRLFDGNKVVKTHYCLSGENLNNISINEKNGYKFSGVFSDEGKTAEYSLTTPIFSDLDLFLSYSLIAPEFSLSSISLTYDGTAKKLNFSFLNHPLSEKGAYSFEWFKNGSSLGTFDGGVDVKNVADSGSYRVKITFSYENDTVSVMTPEVDVTILKATVKLPKIEAKKYTGKRIYSDLKDTAYYKVFEDGGINAGIYDVVFTLCDPDNYRFDNTETESTVETFKIEQAENFWSYELAVKDVYVNTKLDNLAFAAFGEVYYVYSDKIDGEYRTDPPLSVGKYYVKAVVDETDNYRGLVSTPKGFEIVAEKAIGISVESLPATLSYKAFERFSCAGLKIKVTFNSGRNEIIGAEKISIRYQTADSFRFGDNGVVVSYLNCECTVPVNVSKAEYDLSKIVLPDMTVTYDGTYHSISYSGELPIGLDGIALRAEISSGYVNVGKYVIVMSFISDSGNYVLPQNNIATLEIKPFETSVLWGSTEFIYDGQPKAPSAAFTDVYGNIIPLSVTGELTNVTAGATATAHAPSENYLLKNSTVEFKIRKADYSFDNITWSYESFVYDGSEKTVKLSGLPNGVTVIGYTDNCAIEAGLYKATALISYDERNYNAPPILTHEWEIIPAEYDLSGFFFEDCSIIYDGRLHYPILLGKLPVGHDGITLSYSFSKGPVHVSEGRTEVIITFSTESKNYKVPGNISAFVEIIPKQITVAWDYTSTVFDGQAHAPTATSVFCEIIVEGAQINAGEYIAYARPLSTDYAIDNANYSFSIGKAENSWINKLSIADIYASGAPSPSASVIDGEIDYRYYSDEACTKEVSLPLLPGRYYVRATAISNGNYHSLISDPVEFEVVAVVPIGIEATVKKECFVAFERLSDADMTVFVTYNDGTKNEISLDNVNKSYKHGDSFRYNDDFVTLEWNGFSKNVQISVKKASYDMSGASWENTEQIYSGSLLCPIIKGLPAGVTVSSYSGGGINAGNYTVKALFSYDAENYNEPIMSDALFMIKKKGVALPTLEPVIYNGTVQYPSLLSDLFGLSSEGFVNAGIYDVEIFLKDSDNYVFEGGESIATVSFVINKKQIESSVGNIVLYLGQNPKMPSYTLTAGAIGLDDLKLYYEINGDEVLIKSGNPNYDIVSLPGKLIKYDRLSPEATTAITVCGISLLIFMLGLYVIFANRERILNFVAAHRCKEYFKKERAQINEIAPPKKTAYEKLIVDQNGEEGYVLNSVDEESVMTVDVDRADALITDSLAKNLIKRERETVYTDGYRRNVVNVDILSENFSAGDRVDVNTLKERHLISKDTAYVKVLARGSIDKPISVHANAFSLSAVKMIALTGGEAVKVNTSRVKNKEKRF